MSSRGDLYWNRANRPPEVAAFSLKKNIANKFFFKDLRFDDLIKENYSQGHKKFYFLFSCYTPFSCKFNVEFKSEKRFKKNEN